MATIYEITGELLSFYDFISDPDNEYDDQIFKDTLEGLQGEYTDKVENYMHAIVQLEADADALNKEIERLTKRRDACLNPVKRMKNVLLESMQAVGMPKIQTEHFKLSVAKNGGVQPMKLTADLSEIPEEYIIQEPKADTKKIREALASGKELAFAHLEERGVHLNVR